MNKRSGLAVSTRDWYCNEIIKVLKTNGSVSVPYILQEMRKLNQHRFPVQEERIVHFLKFLRATGRVSYTKSPLRRISSKWESVGV